MRTGVVLPANPDRRRLIIAVEHPQFIDRFYIAGALDLPDPDRPTVDVEKLADFERQAELVIIRPRQILQGPPKAAPRELARGEWGERHDRA